MHYLFKPNEQAMVDHFRRMADETGMPIIIYNVVPWSYLSPAQLTRMMNEVPLVVGVKQSAGDLKLSADLRRRSNSAARKPLRGNRTIRLAGGFTGSRELLLSGFARAPSRRGPQFKN